MNEFLSMMKRRGIQCVITYADNDAIGFFKKHGFKIGVFMPEKYWFENIYHYSGGTLVSCDLRPVTGAWLSPKPKACIT